MIVGPSTEKRSGRDQIDYSQMPIFNGKNRFLEEIEKALQLGELSFTDGNRICIAVTGGSNFKRESVNMKFDLDIIYLI